jgi:hypothetical protein
MESLFLFGTYLWMVFSQVWVWVTGVVFGIEEVLERVSPGYRKRLNRYIPPQWRKWLLWGGFVLLVFFSSFSAWKDEHDKVGEQQAALDRQAQEQQRPRRIVKREEFIQALRAAGPMALNLSCIDGDRNAAELFTDLYDLFLAGGWVIRDTTNRGGGSWIGVRVVVADRNVAPPGAALMVKLLGQNEIAARLVEHPTHPALTSETFSVEIGFRP